MRKCGFILFFFYCSCSQGHPKSNFTRFERTDVQHSWRAGGKKKKTQTKHWKKTLGKCPLIPFFFNLCARKKEKKKGLYFVPNLQNPGVLLFKFSTWMWLVKFHVGMEQLCLQVFLSSQTLTLLCKKLIYFYSFTQP